MSDALSYSVELAAERSSEHSYLEKRLQKHGLSYEPLERRLRKLGLKHVPHSVVINSLTSLGNNACNSLDALVESGYKYYNDDKLIDDDYLSSALCLLDAERDTPKKYLNVFRKLKEKLDYRTVNVIDSYQQISQVDKIYKLSKIEGDVCKTIDVLAEIGYNLVDFRGKKLIYYFDVTLIDKITKAGIDGFYNAFCKLREKFGYKTIRSAPLHQIDYILEISRILGYAKAIDHLKLAGYRLRSKSLIMYPDIEEILQASNRLWREALEEIKPCLYKEDSEKFVECFKSLSSEEKKKALKGIFNCKKVTNEEVTRWLDENEPELVREVGIGLI